ncbi:utrophin-like [Choloepus didactylus]|uniref:utrophin-like n=1 Tax=Choloepus didactylus TaxID=27675 RepID=UPI00189D1600|nr:utrophin-like [Choloepus didactylus]
MVEISAALQHLLSELDDAGLQVEKVHSKALILMNTGGVSSRQLVKPKLPEPNRNFEKVSQHIGIAKGESCCQIQKDACIIFVYLSNQISTDLSA